LKGARLDVVGRVAAYTAMRCIPTAEKGSALSRAAADATQSLQLSAAWLRAPRSVFRTITPWWCHR